MESLALRFLSFGDPLTSVIGLGAVDAQGWEKITKYLTRTRRPVFSQKRQRFLAIDEISWILHCLAKTVGKPDVPFDLVGLCIPRLLAHGQVGRDIVASLGGNKGLDVESVGHVMELSEIDHPLMLALEPLIRAKVTAETTDLLKAYGPWVLELADWSNCKLPIRLEPFLQLVQVGFCVGSKLTENIQEQAFARYKYPMRSPLFGRSLLASLFNTSAGFGVHFVDVIFRSMRECIRNGDLEGMIDRMSLVPELQSWLVVAAQPEMLNDSWIFTLAQRKYHARNICVEYMERILNDQELLRTLKNLTGQIYLIEDLTNVSIPLLFSEFLARGYTDGLEKVCQTPLLLVTDEDRHRDSDFVNAYMILYDMLQLVTKVDDRLLDDLSKRLNGIHNQEIIEGLVVDIFSLLFARKPKNKTVSCSLDGAMKLLSLLLKFACDKVFVRYLKDSLRKVQYVRFISSGTTIEKVFVPYNSLLAVALAKKDWAIVDSLGEVHPDLRKRISLAKAVSKYIETGTFDGDDDAQLELFMSVEERKFTATSSNPIVHELIQRRDESDVDWIRMTNSECNALQHMSSKLMRLSASKWTKTECRIRSKSLCHFFDYLDTLIPMGLECEIGFTVMDILGFPIKSLVPFLLRKGRVDEAIQLAEVAQTDIFLEMLKYSEDHSGSVFHLLQENPIVCVAEVLWSRNESVKLPNGFVLESPILRKLIDNKDTEAVEAVKTEFHRRSAQEKTFGHPEQALQRLDIDITEDSLRESLVELLTQTPMPIDLVAEMSFRVDVTWFSDLLMKSLDTINLDDLSSLVNQCACTSDVLEAVTVLNDAFKVCHRVTPYKKGFKCLVKSKRYDLAKRFWCVFGNQINTSHVLSVLASECIELTNESKSVDSVLSICPSLQQQVIDSLPLKVRSLVVENDPTFFSYVPDTWTVCDTPGDTIIRNVLDTTNARLLMERFPGINIDLSLMDLVSSPSTTPRMEAISKLHHGLHLYFPLFRDKLRFCTFVGNKFIEFVEDITVSDGAGESEAGVQLHRLHLGLLDVHVALTSVRQRNDFAINLMRITSCVDSIVEFVFRHPSMRYHISYSLQEFEDRQFGLRMAELCYKFDWDGLAMHFIEAWNLKDCELVDEYALNCFRLGRYDSAVNFAIDRRMETGERTTGMVNRFINVVSFSSFYDNSFVSELVEAPVPIDVDKYCYEFVAQDTKYFFPKELPKTRSRVSSLPTKRMEWNTPTPSFTPHFYKRIAGQVADLLPWFPNPTRQTGLKKYLKMKAPVLERVKHFVKCGNFETAMKILRKSPYQSERDELFWSGIFLTGVLSGYVVKLKKKIPSFDPGLFTFGRLLQEKLEESHEKQLYHLQYLLACICGRPSLALDTAILIFNNTDSNNLQLQLLERIRESLDAATAKADSTTDTSKLEEYKRKLPLQKLFCQVVQQRDLGYCAGLSLFSTPGIAESMAVYLMKEHVFTLALAIISECQLNITGIAEKTSDILVNETASDITKFVTTFEEQADPSQFWRIINLIILRVTYTHRNSELQKLITRAITNPELKCRLLIQYDTPDEALVVARHHHLTHLLPLIGHRSLTPRTVSIVQSALK